MNSDLPLDITRIAEYKQKKNKLKSALRFRLQALNKKEILKKMKSQRTAMKMPKTPMTTV